MDQALQLLSDNQLYSKQSKCSFGAAEVEYLGHFIFADGVKVDLNEIADMKNWPTPRTIKGLYGFLGLIGYYRKFIRDYGKIATPLTTLLKKDSFTWLDAVDRAFKSLKIKMCNTPVLAMPDFTKPFVIESDASGAGIGVVLM